MADAFELTTFDGHSIGPATVYACYLAAEDDIVVQSGLTVIERPGVAPMVVNASSPGRVIILTSDGPDNDDPAAAGYRTNMDSWFSPNKNRDGLRYLERYADDGTTLIRIGCVVQEKRFRAPAANSYIITLFAPSLAWEASAEEDETNPATVTNAGTEDAFPIIELTTTTHVTRRVCTVTGAGAGGGLVAYPVVFDLSDSNATSTNTFVYVEGVSVPCWVDDSGAGTSRVWALVDTASDGTTATHVDIIYGSGLVNPLCQKLSDGGMSFDDNTNTTNTAWEWDDWTPTTVSSNPARPGAWRPALTGNHNPAADATFQFSAITAAVSISLGTDGTFENNADSIRLHVGAQAGTSSALANFSRITANLDGTNARAYVRYRVAGSTNWADAWTTTSNATVTTSIDLDNAVEIAAGIENFGSTADPATLGLSGATTKLTLANAPTVVVGAATDVDFYDGPYTIGSRTITFTDFICPNDTLTIDCGERSIVNDTDGPFYGPENRITFSDPDRWLVLEPGSNTVTDGLTATTDVVRWRDAYS